MNSGKLQEVRFRIEQAEQENERLRANVREEEQEDDKASEPKPKPRRPRLKNLVRAASVVSGWISKKPQDEADEEDREEQPKLFLKGLKKQSELNDEEIEVIERFGLKCKVKLVLCGR